MKQMLCLQPGKQYIYWCFYHTLQRVFKKQVGIIKSHKKMSKSYKNDLYLLAVLDTTSILLSRGMRNRCSKNMEHFKSNFMKCNSNSNIFQDLLRNKENAMMQAFQLLILTQLFQRRFNIETLRCWGCRKHHHHFMLQVWSLS